MSASTTGRTQHPGLVLASMTLANAMVLVDQTAVPLTLAEIMRTYDVGSQKTVGAHRRLVSLPALLRSSAGSSATCWARMAESSRFGDHHLRRCLAVAAPPAGKPSRAYWVVG